MLRNIASLRQVCKTTTAVHRSFSTMKQDDNVQNYINTLRNRQMKYQMEMKVTDLHRLGDILDADRNNEWFNGPNGVHPAMALMLNGGVFSSKTSPDGFQNVDLDTAPPEPYTAVRWKGTEIYFNQVNHLEAPLVCTSGLSAIPQVLNTNNVDELCIRFNHKYDIQHPDEPISVYNQNTIYSYRDASIPVGIVNSRLDLPEPSTVTVDNKKFWEYKPVTVDQVTNFRYNAAKWNSHRIHFDKEYATQVEGYEDVVVHGGLQAVYMLDLLEQVSKDVAGTPPLAYHHFTQTMQEYNDMILKNEQAQQQPEHGHSHGGVPCHGHGEEATPAQQQPEHGHSHGGVPCHGHGHNHGETAASTDASGDQPLEIIPPLPWHLFSQQLRYFSCQVVNPLPVNRPIKIFAQLIKDTYEQNTSPKNIRELVRNQPAMVLCWIEDASDPNRIYMKAQAAIAPAYMLSYYNLDEALIDQVWSIKLQQQALAENNSTAQK